jgi:hypothetical protein
MSDITIIMTSLVHNFLYDLYAVGQSFVTSMESAKKNAQKISISLETIYLIKLPM